MITGSVAKIIDQFEEELPEGEIKNFFKEISSVTNEEPPNICKIKIEEIEKILERFQTAKKKLKEEAPKEVPPEIIKAYEAEINFIIRALKIGMWQLKVLRKFRIIRG